MKHIAALALACSLVSFAVAGQEPVPEFRDLFNGRDLTGWVNVNTAADTWKFKDGLLICSGRPLGVLCSEKQYENFVLHIEWRHMEAGGNSGVFVWSNARPNERSRLPDGVEVQMLELEWPNLNTRNGVTPPVAYVHGELFGVGGIKTVPDNPRGERSMSIENRAKGKGEWNTYDVVAVDGVIKLAVNGKFVNGISRSTQKKGYFCLESEGGEIHFRNIKVLELPPGVTTPEQTAPAIGAGARDQVSRPAVDPIKASLDQLSWVSGAWTGTLGERTIEQHWSAPLAGSIIAMYRSIQGSRATLYELLAIEQQGEGVVLRIKHFSPGAGLVGREAKDESIDHALVKLGDRTAIFEGGTPASPARITFNSPDSATLNITVERQRDGKTVSTEFKYKRMKSTEQ
jgi:hypothetical protein